MTITYTDIALLMGYLLIAKGWTLTRSHLKPDEIRNMLLVYAIFFLASSMIVVLQGSVETSDTAYWILMGIFYGFVYVYILLSLIRELLTIHATTRHLKNGMAYRFRAPLQQKCFMFDTFFIFVFLSIICEIISFLLVIMTNNFSVILYFYEITVFIIVIIIGVLFRPQEYSPFFFMTYSQADDTNNRYE